MESAKKGQRMMQWICELRGHVWGKWIWVCPARQSAEERYCLRCGERQSVVHVDDSEWIAGKGATNDR